MGIEWAECSTRRVVEGMLAESWLPHISAQRATPDGHHLSHVVFSFGWFTFFSVNGFVI